MRLHKQLLTKNECYQVGKKIKVKGILVHSTGANNPNLKRYVGPDDGLLGKNTAKNDWNQLRPDGRQVCVHAFIGKLADGTIATYQTLPFDMRGWHAGGSANDNYIGFEICEDSLKDAKYFNAVYKEAVEFCAYLCKKYGLNPLKDGVVICHSEAHKRGMASNHSDVMHWFPKHGKSMDAFRADVAKKLKEAPKTPVTSVNKSNRYNKPKRLIKYGTSGNDVKWVQTQLNIKQKSKLVVDGIAGTKTKAAILAFQKKNKLSQDGIVGPKTIAKLA